MTRRCVFCIHVFLFLVCLAWQAQALADTSIIGTVAPAEIGIGTFYDGATLKVTGKVPAGSDLVLRFAGAPGEMHMREKGKIFGLLWMNRNLVTFKNVPKVCLIQASRPFAELGPAAGSYRLKALREGVKVEAAGLGSDFDAANEILRLKEREGLCAESVGGFTLNPEVDGMQSFAGTLRLPSALAPGMYQLDAFALKDGTVTGQASIPVTAKLVGPPSWLHDLAFQHGALYGILACVIAILSGFIIGLFFQSKGAH